MIARIEFAPAMASDLSRLNRRIEVVFFKEGLEHRFQIEQCLKRRFKTLYEELVFLEGEYQEMMEEHRVSYIMPELLGSTELRRNAARSKIEKLRLFDENGAIAEIMNLENEGLPTRELLDHLSI